MRIDVSDQILHAAWSCAALAPILVFGSVWWAGLLSGLLIGGPRELVDQMIEKEWQEFHWPFHPFFRKHWNKAMEIGIFGLGGTLATLLI